MMIVTAYCRGTEFIGIFRPAKLYKKPEVEKLPVEDQDDYLFSSIRLYRVSQKKRNPHK